MHMVQLSLKTCKSPQPSSLSFCPAMGDPVRACSVAVQHNYLVSSKDVHVLVITMFILLLLERQEGLRVVNYHET